MSDTAKAWLDINATRICEKLHCRMTEQSCIELQHRCDPKNAPTYIDGSYASQYHPCKDCEHYQDHQARPERRDTRRPPTHVDLSEGKPLRVVPPKKVRIKREPKPKIIKYVEVVCSNPECVKKRTLRLSTTQAPEYTGLCYSCGIKTRIRAANPEPLPKRVTVICPECKEPREIGRAKLYDNRFTGLCHACAMTKEAANRTRTEPRTCKVCGCSEATEKFYGSKWICAKCESIERKEKRKSKQVEVTCIKCGESRTVSVIATKAKGYTGLCVSCSKKSKREKRTTVLPTVGVSCLGCRRTKEVLETTQQRAGFTGECPACAKKRRRNQRLGISE